MSKWEYAKLLTWYVNDSVTAYGIRTTVTLPASSSVGGHLGNGFINFYFSLDDQNGENGEHFESGLSQSLQHINGDHKWHWFSNWKNHSSLGDESGYVYSPNQAVPMELSINPTTDKLEFKVNGGIKATYTHPSGSFTSLKKIHLVIATCDMDYGTEAAIPSPLEAWSSHHAPVTCSGYQYRNAAGSWVNCDSTNSKYPTAYASTGTSSDEVHWPPGPGSHPHVGTPMYYTVSPAASGTITATLP